MCKFASEIINTGKNTMNEIPKCPKCGSEYTYFDGSLYVCPDCSHEFDSVEDVAEVDDVARDSNGAELQDRWQQHRLEDLLPEEIVKGGYEVF